MNKTVNIAKGLSIIAMVIGHVLSSDNILTIFIYKWHMPLFFFFSGYFFNEKKYTPKQFLLRKWRTICIPYIFWSLSILYLHNFLVFLHINDSSIYDFQKYKILTYRVIFEFRQYEALLGTFWFLVQLLIVNLLALLLLYVIRYLKGKNILKYKVFILIISMMGAIILCKYHIVIYYNFNYISLLAFCFFISGYIAKDLNLLGKGKLFVAIIILIFSTPSFREMINLGYNEILFYFITAICGILIIYNISSAIERVDFIGNIYSYIGTNSLCIMILHFASFKIVTFLIMKYYGLSQTVMAQHPVIKDVSFVWKISYIIIGLCVPLIVNEIYHAIKRKFINKEKYVR